MFSFSTYLERQTLPFRMARKNYILKSRHIELAIGGDIHTLNEFWNDILEQITKRYYI